MNLSDIQKANMASVLNNAVSSKDLNTALGAAGDREGMAFSHAAGFRDAAGTDPVGEDAILAIWSMTKVVTTVAALQLSERGSLDLDAPASNYCEELNGLSILTGLDDNGDPTYEPAARAPTARELITHTSGYVYSIWNEAILKLESDGVVPGVLGSDGAFLQAPPVFRPGERWEYGIGIDWLGALIERISGQRLLDFFADNIFDPLGMVDTGYEYEASKMDRSVVAMMRVDGQLIEAPFGQPTPAERGSNAFYSGGGELYSTLADYGRFLTALLNDGRWGDYTLLKPETVDAMFQNQIGDLWVETGVARMPELSNDFDMGLGSPAKWGLGLLLHTEDTGNGRAAGSGSWAGLMNSYYWLDRKQDTWGLFATQVLPFYDTESIATLKAFERALYGVA